MDRMQPAGTYDVSWDARNVPSGMYFYRLAAGGRVQSKKMTVVR